jgi:hypothetical protein
MRATWLVIVLSACGSVTGKQDDQVDAGPGDAGPGDARPGDASPVGDAATDACVGTGMVKLCLDALPRDPLVLDATRAFDTDRDSRCTSFTPANSAWCVIAATRIEVAAGATLSATGSRVLVLVATEAARIDGTIDVASHQLTGTSLVRGAGSQAMECGRGGGAAAASGAGGGAGGSFATRGGRGGTGIIGGSSGGVAPLAAPATSLRGGCAGGQGGQFDVYPGGEPGAGGGAVYLLAPSITVSETGVINASGAGGFGAKIDNHTGAGGGGSGGMIGLESSALRLAVGARIFANGGGGGEGSGCGTPGRDSSGANGQDPSAPNVPALGGRNEPDGGNGGGGALGTADGEPGADGTTTCTNGGGGGGGGGAGGTIVFHGGVTDAGAQISPPAQRTR